jgi:hypothetical protein
METFPVQRNLRPALAAFTLSGLALAQGAPAPRFYVSTGSDVPAGGGIPAVQDGDVVLVEAGAPPSVVRSSGHWRASSGYEVGDVDVDALARRPGSVPGAAGSLAFSVLSDFSGFKDGDVLAYLEGGGLEIVVGEDALTVALGLPASSIDVDALAWDASARLCFSLQNDAPGTTLGDVLDGDILRLETSGLVTRLMTEQDVENKLFQATGSTAAVGDVIGLDLFGASIYVVIQSPSAYDGGVIDCGPAPALVLAEADAGLGGVELDALALVTDADLLPNVRVEPSEAPVGSTVHVEFRGEPGQGLLVLYAGAAGHVPFFGPGFGAWYVDAADPWLNSIFTGPTLPLVPLDATGFYGIDYTLPIGVEGMGIDGNFGWTFQTMALSTLELSEPFRLELF